MHWLRCIHLAIAGAVIGVVGVFSLSDSILGPLRTAASAAADLARWLEAVLGVDLGSRSSLPVTMDTLGHFLVWAVVATVAAGLTGSAARRINLFLTLFTLSALFEIGQHYLAQSRSAEVTDLLGNGAGLVLGFVAYSTIEAVLATRAPSSGDPAVGLR